MVVVIKIPKKYADGRIREFMNNVDSLYPLPSGVGYAIVGDNRNILAYDFASRLPVGKDVIIYKKNGGTFVEYKDFKMYTPRSLESILKDLIYAVFTYDEVGGKGCLLGDKEVISQIVPVARGKDIIVTYDGKRIAILYKRFKAVFRGREPDFYRIVENADYIKKEIEKMYEKGMSKEDAVKHFRAILYRILR